MLHADWPLRRRAAKQLQKIARLWARHRQAAEKVFFFVILSEARNLSSI
jgi:hypothetical protein